MLSALKRKVLRLYFTRRALKNIMKFKEKPTINGKTEFNDKTELGKNTHFNGLIITGSAKVIIGDNFHSGANSRIITSFHNYEGEALPYDRVNINKDVEIGNNVWLGYGVLILGGVKIGDGAIIQAGSVVVSNIPQYGISGGSPARVFKYRDKVRYEKLVKEKRIHKKSFYEQ